MPEVLVTPNVEAVLVDYLNTELTARSVQAHVATKLPTSTPRPAQFVRILAVGGAGTSLVTRVVRIVVDAYAPTETDAQPLGALVCGLILATDRVNNVQFYHPREAGMASELQNFPDPSIGDRARYTATVAVGLRAHAA